MTRSRHCGDTATKNRRRPKHRYTIGVSMKTWARENLRGGGHRLVQVDRLYHECAACGHRKLAEPSKTRRVGIRVPHPKYGQAVHHLKYARIATND